MIKIPAPNKLLQELFFKQLEISKVTAQILINRGITDTEEAYNFLNTSLDNLLDPFSFTDMEKAVNLVRTHARQKNKIMVFGDYDVDGVTSTALLKNTLSRMGIEASHYLPHRVKEGYGLSKNIVSIVKEKDIKLLITVDCGTSSHKELKALEHAGVDVIVTDHHEPADSTHPQAQAVINPKLKNSGYKYRDLAGVGVAYKLCQAITQDKLIDDLDLVSLGTIADVVPLSGENRIIAKFGLAGMANTNKAGLYALIENSGIKNKKITSTFIGFILGPRINASGRVGTAQASLDLLMARDKSEAEVLAKVLEKCNRERQKIEGKIMEEALSVIEREVNFKEHKVIVVSGSGWHQGVLGIVASKIADRFYRPAIVISEDDILCKGSGRSIKNFHLFHALTECSEFLDNFGGHSHAVGLNISRNNIVDFKNKINNIAYEKLSLEDLVPSLDVDMELSLSDINNGLITELEMLEPFGTGNPAPLFYTANLKLKSRPQLLGRDTIKFWLTDSNTVFQAIGFSKGRFMDSLVNADYFDMVYTIRRDTWQGRTSTLLEIKDIIFK
ncbi:MAG: single-stranded-DNA-specific exonuclease RecJ [Candidatus Omnitrophota bacterium]